MLRETSEIMLNVEFRTMSGTTWIDIDDVHKHSQTNDILTSLKSDESC